MTEHEYITTAKTTTTYTHAETALNIEGIETYFPTVEYDDNGELSESINTDLYCAVLANYLEANKIEDTADVDLDNLADYTNSCLATLA